MKYKVRINEQTYEVEVGDLTARPIQAVVDGETFDVWPEEMDSQPVASALVAAAPIPAARPIIPVNAATPAAPPAPTSGGEGVRAPIPGVIISIAVQPGATVKRGQELCMLEAMKMNNAIRSPRDGKVTAVPVSVGQAVKHGDLLVAFEP